MTICKLVTDGKETWLLSRQFYGYSKSDANKLFNVHLQVMKWKLA